MRFIKILFLFFLMVVGSVIFTGCESEYDLTGPEKDSTATSRSASSRHQNGMGGRYSEALITYESGGSLSFWNGTLQVPPHSIDETKIINVRIYSLQQGNFLKRIYEFGPSGTTFDPSAILTLNYCDLGPLMPNSLILKVFNESTGQWEVASHMTNDPDSKTFSGTIEHFSRYSLSGNGQVLRPNLSN